LIEIKEANVACGEGCGQDNAHGGKMACANCQFKDYWPKKLASAEAKPAMDYLAEQGQRYCLETNHYLGKQSAPPRGTDCALPQRPVGDSIPLGIAGLSVRKGELTVLYAEGMGTSFSLKAGNYMCAFGYAVSYLCNSGTAGQYELTAARYGYDRYPAYISVHGSFDAPRDAILSGDYDVAIWDEIISKPENLLALRDLAREKHVAIIGILGAPWNSQQRVDNERYLQTADSTIRLISNVDGKVVLKAARNDGSNDQDVRFTMQKTLHGLFESAEAETGFREAQNRIAVAGVAAFPDNGGKFGANQVITSGHWDISRHFAQKPLVGVDSRGIAIIRPYIDQRSKFLLSYIAQEPAKQHWNLKDIQLASLISVLSWTHRYPLPVNVVFGAYVREDGILVPQEGLTKRVKRAKEMGYPRFIGAKAPGLSISGYEGYETIGEVWKALTIEK
jgi:hypothetical protein